MARVRSRDTGMTRPAHAPRHRDALQPRARAVRRARPKAIDFFTEDSAEHTHAASDDDEDRDTNGDSEEGEEENMDAPRVAQWIDDDELDLQGRTDSLDSDGTHSEDGHTEEARPLLQSLEDDLSRLPLGTLRSAQRSLSRAQALSDPRFGSRGHSDFSTSEDDDSSSRPVRLGEKKEMPDRLSKPKNVTTKRTNKHAPVEVTSKRPVSRQRTVVDETLPKPRDPRFMHAAGRYDPSKFKRQYDFLSSLRKEELSTLREHTKRAQKFLANSPSYLKAEREEEANRLAHAVKRTESAVNLDDRERVESEALRSAKQTEKEKRRRGKAGWWMKRSEKKALLVKARMDAIASVGGKQAVKKAVEKKQKKISQKEKKMRPFPRSEGTERSDGKKRRPAGSVGGAKRRRMM